MARKRITERFPWLLPVRQFQRKLLFYLGMRLDKNTYTKQQVSKRLPEMIFQERSPMIHRDSGFDIRYQYNKAHNLKLAAKKVDGVIIRPGETFSLWRTIKNADKENPYLDGLSLVNGEIRGEYGGGLCQLSNLLYFMALHTPLTVAERHGHGRESIPPVKPEEPAGVDATIAEGWLDLKLKNSTGHTFQLGVTFHGDDMIGAIYSESEKCYEYEIYNPVCRYTERDGVIYQEADVARKRRSCFTGEVTEEILYHNSCIIDYPLPEAVLKNLRRQEAASGASDTPDTTGVTSAPSRQAQKHA